MNKLIRTKSPCKIGFPLFKLTNLDALRVTLFAKQNLKDDSILHLPADEKIFAWKDREGIEGRNVEIPNLFIIQLASEKSDLQGEGSGSCTTSRKGPLGRWEREECLKVPKTSKLEDAFR